MKLSRTLYLFALIFFVTASCFSANALAQTVEDRPNDLIDQFFGNSVEGVWNLNIDESDDIEQKIRTLIQKSFVTSDKTLSAEQTEIPSISISILPPERIVLLRDEDKMTINEFHVNVISTRTLITDGQNYGYQADNNADVAISAIRKKNKLSIETLSPRGNKMIETFELSADRSKLKVTVQISDSNLQEVLTLRRIYDRTILDDFSDYN